MGYTFHEADSNFEGNNFNLQKKNIMKNLNILFALALAVFLTSCGKDELNFIGQFELSKIEMQCPTSDRSFEEGSNGVCIPDGNNFSCFEWKFDIFEDGTFTELIKTHSITPSLKLSQNNNKEGTYTIVENQITFVYADGASKDLSMNNIETALTGYIVGTTDSGCEIFTVFSRN